MAYGDNFAALQGTHTQLPPIQMSGLNVNIILDSSDQRFDEKMAALQQALQKVQGRVGAALAGLDPMTVYFGERVKCEATWNPEGPGGATALFLGDRMMFQTNRVMAGQDRVSGMGQMGARGVADQAYDDKRMNVLNPNRILMGKTAYQAQKADAKAMAVVVHEIGHMLHERQSSAIFWQNKRLGAATIPANIAQQISSYLINNNYDELVAEVFAGLVHGKTYSQAVMQAYQAQGGP
jgi:hypothetical protein